MKITHVVISAGAAVVIGVGGGVVVARVSDHTQPVKTGAATSRVASESPAPTPTPTPTAASPTASSAAPRPTATAKARSTSTPTTAPRATSPTTSTDRLSAENLIRERLYHDVTGHSFSVAPEVQSAKERLGPCTGDMRFSDVLPPQGLTQLETILAGSDVLRVTELLAQTRSVDSARAAADHIVAEVDRCPGIQGGDFGYGDPVTLQSDANGTVVYFAGYDSDRQHGGYIVFSVGTRVGVISVADEIGARKVAHLAREAATIAGV